MAKQFTERCEGIVAGRQCKCWATGTVNSIPYCKQHLEKALREAVAMLKPAPLGEKRDAPKGEGK